MTTPAPAPGAPPAAPAAPAAPLQIPPPGTTPPPTPTPAGETPAPPGEKLYAGKFKSVDELEKGYTEAQKILSQPKVVDDVHAAIATAGVTLEELSTNFAANGKLTDDQYAKLRAQGIGKGAADAIAGRHVANAQLVQERQAGIRSKCEQIAGGATQLEGLFNFAASTLTAAELASVNAQLANPQTAEFAVRTLMAKHTEAVGAGRATKLLAGQAPPSTARGFDTHDEYIAAMRAISRTRGQADPATAARIRATPESIKRGLARS